MKSPLYRNGQPVYLFDKVRVPSYAKSKRAIGHIVEIRWNEHEQEVWIGVSGNNVFTNEVFISTDLTFVEHGESKNVRTAR